jgi:hypothetical protein
VNTAVTQSIAELGSYFDDNTKINNAMELRYCATNRKVTGLVPDGVIGIFH